ncbi:MULTISPECIES: hypothetical protein [unclassified Paenibacillus]|uniref:hypothetical protein n=1 Tax=unclassified Paenibacillus TaxID=185978 RepID=UPI0024B9CD52|nr:MULTISPECIES: hypothetical protein [unclassified Paenibacillus]
MQEEKRQFEQFPSRQDNIRQAYEKGEISTTIALNKIVIPATRVVSDIEFIAKQVILIKAGKLVLQEEPQQILERMKEKVFEVQIEENALAHVQEQYKASNITSENGGVCVRIVSDSKPIEGDVRSVKPNLEDVYLYMFDQDSN